MEPSSAVYIKTVEYEVLKVFNNLGAAAPSAPMEMLFNPLRKLGIAEDDIARAVRSLIDQKRIEIKWY